MLYTWLEGNLGLSRPQDLRAHGVAVYAPADVPRDLPVVDLADGRVHRFSGAANVDAEAAFADEAQFVAYCRSRQLAPNVRGGRMMVQPHGFTEAGPPLRQGGT